MVKTCDRCGNAIRGRMVHMNELFLGGGTRHSQHCFRCANKRKKIEGRSSEYMVEVWVA